jgi:hypothetical protein
MDRAESLSDFAAGSWPVLRMTLHALDLELARDDFENDCVVQKAVKQFSPGAAAGGEHVINGIARLGGVNSGGFLPDR